MGISLDSAGIVIVGGGLAGLRSAEALRSSGYTGAITIVGDEPRLPYDRPSLSKGVLVGHGDIPELRRRPAVNDVTWRLGAPVVASDLAAGLLRLADGSEIEFDGLVIASGIRPRRLPIPGPQGSRHVLRSADDALSLRAELAAGADVVVLGAGFVGCEVAASARQRGAGVTVVALDGEPLLRPLGAELGAALRRRHEARGVHFRLGCTVDSLDGDGTSGGDDRIATVRLSDGTDLPASVFVEAVGSVPNTEWLAGNGLDLTDGIVVDSAMQVYPLARAGGPPVVAAGDIARIPLAGLDATSRRVEHWSMATDTARRAGRTLADLVAGREPDRSPFRGMPSFWSDQYEHQVQALGLPERATRAEVVSGDADGPCVVEYRRDDVLVGVVGIDRTDDVAAYRGRIGEQA